MTLLVIAVLRVKVKRAVVHEGDEDYFPVDAIDQPRAQGITFLCPVCFVKNRGKRTAGTYKDVASSS
jgi:hypothetical protein